MEEDISVLEEHLNKAHEKIKEMLRADSSKSEELQKERLRASKLQQELDKMREEMSKLQRERLSVESDARNIQHELGITHEEISQLQRELKTILAANYKKRFQESEATNRELQNKLHALNGEIEASKSNADKLQKELDRMIVERSNIDAEMSQLQEGNNDLEYQVQEQRNKRLIASKEIDAITARLKDTEGKVAALQKDLQEEQFKRTKAESDDDKIQQELDKTIEEMSDINMELIKANMEKASMDNKYKALQKVNEEHNIAINSLETHITKLKEEIRRLEKDGGDGLQKLRE